MTSIYLWGFIYLCVILASHHITHIISALAAKDQLLEGLDKAGMIIDKGMEFTAPGAITHALSDFGGKALNRMTTPMPLPDAPEDESTTLAEGLKVEKDGDSD